MRRRTRRGLGGGIVLQRLGKAAADHPVGAVLVLCVVFLVLGQPVLAAVVALAVVIVAPPSRPQRPWRRWRR